MRSAALLLCCGLLLASCSRKVHSTGSTETPGHGKVYTESGKASYYAEQFNGRKTANGEIFNMNQLTAAHRTLPFNTLVKVTNKTNGKSVQVRINDRGPFVKGRIIDVSKEAARQLGMLGAGVADVQLSYRK
ncbi:septal ring lytic transglycosylase RlpA family protein [Deminuibacter soli]|uniref:Probable endolytic peptidoglycan transglycosylase RlpA n=2 Tax=Deminuibacter soli TaxID=2291815 RepID=A0A3E1NSA2_9BACT|nr:septal ring lytic transglycosylase RlpA family protein [Deminuibacter soli]